MKEKDEALRYVKIDKSDFSFENLPNFKKGYEIYSRGGVYSITRISSGIYRGLCKDENDEHLSYVYFHNNQLSETKCDCVESHRYPGVCKHAAALAFKVLEEYGFQEDIEDTGFFKDEY